MSAWADLKAEAWISRRIEHWSCIVPPIVAEHQVAWERAAAVQRMRDTGMTLAAIGAAIGVTHARVGQILLKHSWHPKSPAARFLELRGDTYQLAKSQQARSIVEELAR